MTSIPLSRPPVDDEIKQAVLTAMDSRQWILGPQCKEFEKELASYVGVRHCVLTSSATAGLWLTLRSLGVKGGDEVLVPSHTAFPTIEAICVADATPVFVDTDDYYTMDAVDAAARLTPRTVGVLPVHLYGQPVDLPAVRELANRLGLWMLEDCAQAHGAAFEGRRVGAFGRAAVFSFYPSKNLTVMGDGGAVVTDDDEIAARCRRLRNHGRLNKDVHAEVGFNLRFNEIQAAIGRVLLRRLDTMNERRRRADEEQPRPRPACGDGAHGREHLFPPSPGADADLGDEQIVAGETELAADGRAVDAGMKAIEVGAGVNDLDLLWRDAAGDEAALDRVTHGHDRLDAAGRIADAPQTRHRKADTAVEHEPRAATHQSRQQRQRARAPLVGVRDLDAAARDHARQTPRRAGVPRASHRHRHVLDAERAAALGPHVARRRGKGHVMAARRQAGREVTQLDRGAGEEVSLGVELQDAQGAPGHQAPKNALTAIATVSISASVWPAEIGSVRISSTSRSVWGSGAGAKCSTAGWRCPGTG